MAGVRESRAFLDNTPVKIGAALWLMVTLALVGAALFYLPSAYGTGESVLLWILALPVLGAAGVAVLFLLRGEGENAAAAAIASGALFAAIAFAAIIPRLDQVAVSRKAADLITSSGSNRIAIVGFHEPSIVFQVASKTREVKLAQSAGDAADYLTKNPNAVALIESRMDNEFHQRLTQLNFVAEPFGKVDGINYSNGRQVALTLYRLRKTGP
jgi:hypothetical protein